MHHRRPRLLECNEVLDFKSPGPRSNCHVRSRAVEGAMFRLRTRKLVLIYRCAAVFAAATCCTASRAAEPTEVRGLLATRVAFDDVASEQLAAASLELLAQCSLGQAASAREWAAVDRGCHLRFRFDSPRAVSLPRLTNGRDGMPEKPEIAEMILSFPLNSGRIWVRSGDEYARYAKWPVTAHAQLCDPIQRLLREASPVE